MYPALGKEADVRSFMTDWVKSAQEQGENLALTQRIYTSEGPMLMIPRRYDDLAAADARRRENLADPAWQERLGELSTMLREPIRQTLEETVVPMGAATGPVGTVRRVFFHPAQDKAGALRSTLTEFVQGVQAAGNGQIGLSQQIFSESGPLLVLTTTHADVAALDKVRQERAEAAQALVDSVSGFLRAPLAIRLLSVIVPFPS